MKYIVILLILFGMFIGLVAKTMDLELPEFKDLTLTGVEITDCQNYPERFIGPIKECDTRGGQYE